MQPGWLEISKKATDAGCSLEQHTNLPNLRSFPGLSNLFQWFVPYLAHKETQISCMLEKTWLFTLGYWTKVKLRCLKQYSIECRLHQYWHYQDQTAIMPLRPTYVRRYSGVCFRGSCRKDWKAREVLVTFVDQGWTGIQHNTYEVFAVVWTILLVRP